MIENISCDCIIIGDVNNLIPLIPIDIRIVRKIMKGQIILDGRFKNEIAQDSQLILDGSIDDILDFLLSAQEILINKSLDFMCLGLTIKYLDQCNFELTIDQLVKIAKLKISLGISCYSE